MGVTSLGLTPAPPAVTMRSALLYRNFHYRSHKTEKVEEERVDVYTFIGRMIQHVLPKVFKRIRYYGVQAKKTFEQVKGIIQC